MCARRRKRLGTTLALLVLSAICLVGRGSLAGGGAATDAYEDIGPRALDIHGLTDFYFEHDFNQPSSGNIQLRAFDAHGDTPYLNLARLTLAHRPDVIGFRLDAGIGDTTEGFRRSDPAASKYPQLSRGLSWVEQAFVTARLPVGRGISLDVGKFGTPVGLEDNETQQNWNYSRSLLYTWAEPTLHTGVRATYPVIDTAAVSAFWVNGWNANLLEGNGMRSFAGAVTWYPTDSFRVAFTYMGGLERAPTRLSDRTLGSRHEFDLFSTYALTKSVWFAFTADYGLDSFGGGVSWWGLGGYVRYEALPWLAGTVRAEHFADPDGFTIGTRQQVAEMTATIEAAWTLSCLRVLGRIEYRRDQSDALAFQATSGSVTRQDTLTLGLTSFF